MNIYASIAMTFIPLVTVYICFLLLGKDFNKVHGAAACLCGLLALLPIELLLIIIHTWHPFASVNLPGRLIKGLLINGIIEESAKMAFLFLLPAKKSKLSAFFSYAVLCGLTLGCLETLIYLIYGNRSITLRLFTAVVMHTFCAGLSGLFVYCIKRRQELADKSLLWLPFALAVLFHGLYNYFAGIYGTLHYFAYAVIAATILECKLRYQSVKIKFERKASVNPGLENQGDAKKMGFGFLKKIFGSSEEAAEKTQVQESAQTVAEDDATIADDATMVDSDSTLVSEDNSSDETISSDVQADMSFAMHTAAELASDKPRSDDKFAEALKLVDVFDEDKDPQPDPISETEAFESIEKAEKAVTKSTRGRKKGSTVKKTAEKAVKEAKTTAKKTAKTAEKKASAAKKAVTKKATAAKKTAEKAVKKTAAKASTAKKTAASKAAGAKASATKKVKAAKATVAKKSATLKATKASAAKKTATAKATTAKKTAAKKTTK